MEKRDAAAAIAHLIVIWDESSEWVVAYRIWIYLIVLSLRSSRTCLFAAALGIEP